MPKCWLPAALLQLLVACSAPAALHGTAVVPPEPAANFVLSDQSGRAFALAQNRGSAIALYFGFTHCRDVCPETLRLLGHARTSAGLSDAQVHLVMITVDPKHDDPRSFDEFFRKIGVRAIGLTGSPAQLKRVYKAYGVVVEPGTPDLAHTDVIYLIDPQGRLRELLDPKTPLNDVAQDLRSVVDS